MYSPVIHFLRFCLRTCRSRPHWVQSSEGGVGFTARSLPPHVKGSHMTQVRPDWMLLPLEMESEAKEERGDT